MLHKAAPGTATTLLDDILAMTFRILRARYASAFLWSAAALVAWPSPGDAQTDYYNTDAGRPVVIEDAYPVERRALEVQAAPLRVERASGGMYTWALEPEIAYGVLPRTQIEVGLPLVFSDAGAGGSVSGLAGVRLSALHNLNVETSIPALAIASGVLLPVGGLGPDRAYVSAKGILTRTFTWMRVHLNAEYTFGSRPGASIEGAGVAEVSRWLAGVAVDRTLPLRSMLITAEVVAREPIARSTNREWLAGAGVRRQLTPRWAFDAGAGRRLAGDHQGWYLTFGTAYAFALPWHGGPDR